MGCCFSGSNDPAKQKLLSDVHMDEEESEAKADQPRPDKPKVTDEEIPEMSVNRLTAKSLSAARRGNAEPASALDTFKDIHNTNTDPYDGGAAAGDHGGGNAVQVLPEDNEIMDSAGDIHINRYYNETRNANLSITSKVTDLSAKPLGVMSKTSMDSVTTFNTGLVSNPTDESQATDADKMLWSDGTFSDKQTVMSFNQQQSTV
eukprot:CAMPEP_0197050086 /NCGR_PEP_ID=MMETSP1384-20130603/25073_1 /TAXON_ID=29189 /ORGANISM="Ammonia sp." /LENGTH=203 /DNA_ID=CAMNT_0042482449 /DNA_START=10 /DNA_END=621 /DNA_ORIENTATION=+